MTRLQALTHLDHLIQGRWNLIEQIKARKLTKADERSWTNAYKLEIEALQMARDALRNPGYVYTASQEMHDG